MTSPNYQTTNSLIIWTIHLAYCFNNFFMNSNNNQKIRTVWVEVVSTSDEGWCLEDNDGWDFQAGLWLLGSDNSGLLKWGSTHAGYDGLLGLWQIFARQLSWFLPLCPLAFYTNLKKKILEASLIVVVNFKKAQCIQSNLCTSCIQNHASLLRPVNQLRGGNIFLFLKTTRISESCHISWMITKKRADNWVMVLLKHKSKSKCHYSSDWSRKTEGGSKPSFTTLLLSYPTPIPNPERNNCRLRGHL